MRLVMNSFVLAALLLPLFATEQASAQEGANSGGGSAGLGSSPLAGGLGKAGGLGEAVGMGGADGMGESGLSGMAAGANFYRLLKADGTVEEGQYLEARSYYLGPGMAKPRRLSLVPGAYNFAIRTGQGEAADNAGSKRVGLSASPPRSLPLPPGGLAIEALILENNDGEPHRRVIVETTTTGAWGGMPGRGIGSAESPGSMMGSGMPGGMMGSGLGGEMMGMSGGGMMGGGMMGGGMMGGGMMDGGSEGSGMEGGMGMDDVKVVREMPDGMKMAIGSPPNASLLSPEQLTAIAELVRLDCWIDEELAALRATRNDQESFKAHQSELKELLNKEYQLQLARQREDIERLKDKLKSLEQELARRNSAQERIIDVQLGQLVLEAQDLIGERP